jgi:hypothetical protein
MMNMKDFWLGFFAGAVSGVVGYRIYEQNGGQLQNLIMPACGPAVPAKEVGTPTLEELVAQKERLEDLIAEKKMDS